MLILDTLLLAPIYGTLWIARQIDRALQEERAAAPEEITTQLRDLYMMLETGRITELEFAERERALLDELDRIQPPSDPHRPMAPKRHRRQRQSANPKRQRAAA